MPKAERLSLPHVVDVGEIVGLLREREPRVVVLRRKRSLQLDVLVEVVFQRALAAAGDEQQVIEPSGNGFFDDKLDRWLVDDGQHFLRHRFRCGQEPGSQPRRGDDCSRDACHGA